MKDDKANARTYLADVYIYLTNSQSCTFSGTLLYEVRKNVPFPINEGCGIAIDLHCNLAGDCGCTSQIQSEQVTLASGQTHTAQKTFVAKKDGSYHFDVWWGDYHYGRTADVTLQASGGCGDSCDGTYPDNPCAQCNYLGGCSFYSSGTSCTVCSGTSNPPTYGGCTDCYTKQSGTCDSSGNCGSLSSDKVCDVNCGAAVDCSGLVPGTVFKTSCGGSECYCEQCQDGLGGSGCLFDVMLSTANSPVCCGLWGGNHVSDSAACCSGTLHNVTIGYAPCCSDADCTGFDPVTHRKIFCDCPDTGCSIHTRNDYTCQPLSACKITKTDCDDGYCCGRDSAIASIDWDSGSCDHPSGSIYKSKYLCDPPEWSSTGTSNKEIKTDNWFDLIFNFFFNPFS